MPDSADVKQVVGDAVKLTSALLNNVKGLDTHSQQLVMHWKAIQSFLAPTKLGFKSLVMDMTGLSAKAKVADDYVTRLSALYAKDKMTHFAAFNALKKQLETFRPKPLDFFSVGFLAILGTVIHDWGKLNKSITEANSMLDTRRNLMRSILEVQRQTGSSLEEAAAAARSLVRFGVEARPEFAGTMDVVVKMQKALGISTDQGAELAFIFESRLKAGARGVADVITDVVDKTALMADEATRFATELGKAMLFLRTDVRDPIGATRFITRLEGAIKEAAGVPGEMASLMTEAMSTFEGATRVLRLGVTPQSLGGAGGQEALTKQLTALARPFVELAKTDLVGGMAGLEAMSQAFTDSKVSVQTLRALVEQEDKLRVTRGTALTLDQKWATELESSNEAWTAIIKSIRGLLREGLYPVVWAINKILGSVRDLFDVLMHYKSMAVVATTIAMGVLASASIYAIRRLWTLHGTLVQLGNAAIRAAEKVEAASLMGQIPSTSGGGRSMWQTATQQWAKFGEHKTGWLARRGTLGLGALGKKTATLRLGQGFIGGILKWIPTVLGVVFSLPVLAVIAAGLAGIGLGLLIDSWWNKKRGSAEAKVTSGGERGDVIGMANTMIEKLKSKHATQEQFRKEAENFRQEALKKAPEMKALISNMQQQFGVAAKEVYMSRMGEAQTRLAPPSPTELRQLYAEERQADILEKILKQQQDKDIEEVRRMRLERKRLEIEENERHDKMLQEVARKRNELLLRLGSMPLGF